MDAISVYVQHSMVNNMFDMKDVAILQCVSKEMFRFVSSYIDNNKSAHDAILHNTAQHLHLPGLQPCLQCSEHIVNIPCLFKQLICIERLYRDEKRSSKMVDVLNDFTSHAVGGIWTETMKSLSFQKQKDTLSVLLMFFNHDNIQHNIIMMYIMMYFVSKLIQQNKSTNMNKDLSLMAYSSIRRVMLEKCNFMRKLLNTTITPYPYFFVSRVIRKINDVRRLIEKLA